MTSELQDVISEAWLAVGAFEFLYNNLKDVIEEDYKTGAMRLRIQALKDTLLMAGKPLDITDTYHEPGVNYRKC